MMIITSSDGQIKPQLLNFSRYSLKPVFLIEMFIVSIRIFGPHHLSLYIPIHSLLHPATRFQIPKFCHFAT